MQNQLESKYKNQVVKTILYIQDIGSKFFVFLNKQVLETIY
jgi:hypothetical protein